MIELIPADLEGSARLHLAVLNGSDALMSMDLADSPDFTRRSTRRSDKRRRLLGAAAPLRPFRQLSRRARSESGSQTTAADETTARAMHRCWYTAGSHKRRTANKAAAITSNVAIARSTASLGNRESRPARRCALFAMASTSWVLGAALKSIQPCFDPVRFDRFDNTNVNSGVDSGFRTQDTDKVIWQAVEPNLGEINNKTTLNR